MGAMKAMAAMKAMRAMKKRAVSKIARSVVFRGTKAKTASGLAKTDLMKSKSGKIVSKKQLARRLTPTSRAGLLLSRRPGRLWASRASSQLRRELLSTRRPRSSSSEQHTEAYQGFSSGRGDVYGLRAQLL